MIFIGGIHGVGKSHFCETAKAKYGYNTYSASALISERKKEGFPSNKLIPDIDDNQHFLSQAIFDLNTINPQYLLDGHFCLLDAQGIITRIPQQTFCSIRPNAIILLTERPDEIARRRMERDRIEHDVESICRFQDEEIAYATEISAVLGIPLWISKGIIDQTDTLEFLHSVMRRVNCAW